MEVQVGGVLFQVVEGDITTVETDAAVNAANNHFWMGGGVAGAIKRAGGGNIEIEAMSQGPRQVGETVVTDGGALPAEYVIHDAIPCPGGTAPPIDILEVGTYYEESAPPAASSSADADPNVEP